MKRWLLGFSALAYSMCGSACASFPGIEFKLPAPLDEAFHKLTGHTGITLGEKLIVYGTKNPPDMQMRCHEHFHQTQQARKFNDAAVAAGAILDTDRARMVNWLLTYSQAALEAKLSGKNPYDNRFESAAYEACPNPLASEPTP